MNKLIKSKGESRNPGFGEAGLRWLWNFLLAGMAMAIPALGLAQPDTLWTKIFNERFGRTPLQFIRSSQGGFAIGTIGYSGRFEDLGRHQPQELCVVKLDDSGEIEWTRFMVSGYDTALQRPTGGNIWTIAQTYDNGYIIAGGRIVARVGANGDSLWLRRYINNEFIYSYGEMECCIAPDSNIVVVTGEYLVKLSFENGDIIWRTILEHDVFNIEPAEADGFIAAGYTGFWDNVYAVRIDADGELIWEREYEADESEICHGITQSIAGGWCLAVSSRYGNESPESYHKLIRIDEEGEILWQRIYDDFDWDSGTSDILETADGGFLAVGAWRGDDYFVYRTDFAGDVLWQTHYGRWEGGIEYGTAYSVLLMDDGGYAIGGFSNRGCYLVRTEPDPVVLPFELEALEESHDFREVAVDSVVAWELPLHNFGRRYVFIDSVVVSGADSAFSSADLNRHHWPCRVDPTDTAFVPIVFSPDSARDYSARLTFFFGDSQSVEVSVSGRGVVPGSVPPFHFSPITFHLYPAFPNPFNSSTLIRFLTSPINREATLLSVLNLSGREVARLLDQNLSPGSHSVLWDASNQPSGIYLIRLATPQGTRTTKVTLIR